MRKLALLAAVPFALGCAQQSAVRAPSLPTAEPLQVRLFQPTGGALNYQLSEPAYVAIFAVTRGHGISMVFPHYVSQADHRSHAGLNRETVHGGSGAWGYSSTARNDHRALFGYADAYYVIASKYPLPVDGMLQSPWVLRSLVGADVFRATNLTDTWAALESVLVEGLPAEAWSADVYLNWRDPFMTAAWSPQRFMEYCNDGRGFLATSMLSMSQCDPRRTTISRSPPVPVPVAAAPRIPPVEPADRNPSVPWSPPRIGPGDVVGQTSRAASRGEGVTRSQPEPRRSEPEPRRSEPTRAAESRPQATRTEAKRPEPQPDPN